MSRVRVLAVPAVAAAAALVAAACGSSGAGGRYGQPAPSTAPTTTGRASATATPAPGQPATRVMAASSPLGRLLVDGSGRSLYLFEADTTHASTCYDACAQAWPPLLADGTPGAGADVTGGDLATSARRDDTVQVTYHGHPLYFFAGDQRPGDTTGQGLLAFGAHWFVVGTDGTKIDA
jgi:predicted lipoprotein with Yx(FWY)xxD motif